MSSNCPLRTTGFPQTCLVGVRSGQAHAGRISAQLRLSRSFPRRRGKIAKLSFNTTPEYPTVPTGCGRQWRLVRSSSSSANDSIEPAAGKLDTGELEAGSSNREEASREAQLSARMAELDELLQAENEEDALQLLKQLAGKSDPSKSDDNDGRAHASPLLLGFGKGSLVGCALNCKLCVRLVHST